MHRINITFLKIIKVTLLLTGKNILVMKIKVIKIKQKFDAILNDIKNVGRTTNPTSVKSRDSTINLHPLIIKLLNAGKTMLKKDYGFDEVFNIFDEIDNNCPELRKYNPRISNMINRKNVRDCS